MSKLHTVPRLGQIWQRSLRMAGTSPEQMQLSPKQFGQLKYLRSIVGAETANVLQWSVENWTRFAWRARVDAGLLSAPHRPHIGFLVVHCETAFNMMAKEVPSQIAALIKNAEEARLQALAALAEECAEEITPLPPQPPLQPAVVAEEPHHLTDEELYDMLEGLKP